MTCPRDQTTPWFELALCIETFSEPSNYIQTHIVKLKKKPLAFWRLLQIISFIIIAPVLT